MLGDGVLRALLPIMEPDESSSRPFTGRSIAGAPYCDRHITRDVTGVDCAAEKNQLWKKSN